MNRLAPLVMRLPERAAPLRALAAPRPWSEDFSLLGSDPVRAGDLKLFATAWLGGIVFFGTLLA